MILNRPQPFTVSQDDAQGAQRAGPLATFGNGELTEIPESTRLLGLVLPSCLRF
ncbi:hypothetical protein [uncultured Propionibacterium sp.]|uniref:hypothetical protein n=1 Tax=uncultured Propionibacterium sp. TaxID=218066 RepID=UPI00292FF6DF|nr:hypothetical protein [uncultured Propionibacterium sp.]